MNRKNMPLLLMLIAGACTWIVTLVRSYSLLASLVALFAVMLLFYCLGNGVRLLLDHFDRQNEEKVKQEQAQRALPANYARQLVEQSEVLVKKNLEEQVKKFQTMAGEHLLMRMIHRKHGLFLEQEIRQIMLLSKNFMLYYVTMRLKFNKVIWL